MQFYTCCIYWIFLLGPLNTKFENMITEDFDVNQVSQWLLPSWTYFLQDEEIKVVSASASQRHSKHPFKLAIVSFWSIQCEPNQSDNWFILAISEFEKQSLEKRLWPTQPF